MTNPEVPENIQAIKHCGYVTWAGDGPDPQFRAHFDDKRIPVAAVRHVRVWGLQVDDERALPGHERSFMEDDELWQLELVAKDGSKYEVNASLVRAAPVAGKD